MEGDRMMQRMDMSRRAFLGSAAAGSALIALPDAAHAALRAWPNDIIVHNAGKHDYTAAIEAIRSVAAMELVALGLPGMILELADADGMRATITLGWADMASRTPVGPDHLFEIGSISKSLTALTLWSLAAEGKCDLNAPLSRYLPAAMLPTVPITALDLLNHVSGICNGGPVVPANRPWTAARPGTHFYYSNTGYELAGLLIDQLSGRPHAEEIARRVLRPIGMANAAAHIRVEDRARYATGYVAANANGAPMAGSPLVEGIWTDLDMAAGSVVANAADMHAYLAYVIGFARGAGGPLLSDADAARFLAASVPAAEFGPGARYSSGFERTFIDGKPMLHHTGGMLMFASSFDVDGEAGVGAFASVNAILGSFRPIMTTAYAMRALRAAAAGSPLLPPPDPMERRRVHLPARFAGRWVASDGTTINLVPDFGGLALESGGARGAVEGMGSALLVTSHPAFTNGALEFSGAGHGDAAPFTRMWWRDRLFARDTAPAAPTVPPRLATLAGYYDSQRPWTGALDIVARGNDLVWLGAGKLLERRDGLWEVEGEDRGFERLRFDTPIAGRTMRLNFSGWNCMRLG